MKKLLSSLLWSSADPNKVSATATGIIVFFASVITSYAASKGVVVTEAGVQVWASNVGAAVGAVVTAFGLIRKAVISYNELVNPEDK